MLPSGSQRRPKNSSRTNLLISAGFHGIIIALLMYFAAREGLLGKELKKIAVEMVKETPPEPRKPEEPPKPPELPPEAAEPPPQPSPTDPTPPREVPRTVPPPAAGNASAAPPPAAPPAAEIPSFTFEGGRAVTTVSDPVELYRHLVEHSIRSRWERPADVEDRYFVAEVEVSVDRTGRVGEPAWKKKTGHAAWDASVFGALAATPSIAKPPPTNFPTRVVVRFDVQEVEDVFTAEDAR